MSEKLEPIRAMIDRLQELAASLGLEMVQHALITDQQRQGRDAISVVFMLPEGDIPEPQPELPAECAPIPELDDELAGILSATKEFEQESERNERTQIEEEKTSAAVENMLAMRRKLAEGKGPLDD